MNISTARQKLVEVGAPGEVARPGNVGCRRKNDPMIPWFPCLANPARHGAPQFMFVPSSRSYGHHQNFCVIDCDRTFLAAEIPPKAAPTPQLGRTDKTTLHKEIHAGD